MSASLDSFMLPDIWTDDDKMYYLMQPIKRPQHVDPESYFHKVTFWRELILRYARTQRVLVVNVKALKSVFSRYFPEEGLHLSPECLCEVMASLEKSADVKVYNDKSSYLMSFLKSGLYYISVPLSATLQLALEYFPYVPTSSDKDKVVGTQEDIDQDKLYVFTKFADELLQHFISHFNSVSQVTRLMTRLPAYELSDFESNLADFFPHEATRNYIRKLCSDVYRCVKMEKVHDPNVRNTSEIVWVSEHFQTKISGSSNSDLAVLAGIIRLKTMLRQQESEEQTLAAEIEDRRTRIKVLLAKNKMNEAKNLLRRTKILEKSLERKRALVHHLESMRMQLDNTADNQSVLCALADSNRALKQTLGGAAGLQEAEETMSQVAEGIQETNEITDLIASLAGTSLETTDMDELEDQLQNLLESSRIPKKDETNEELAALELSVREPLDKSTPSEVRRQKDRVAVLDHN